MLYGRSSARVTRGYSAEEQQEWVTWGQSFTTDTLAAPGPSTVLPNIEQLVDIRYERPTTWTIARGFQLIQKPAIGDTLLLLWAIRLGIGQLNVEYAFEDTFTVATAVDASAPQRVFLLTVPAQIIQVRITNITSTNAAPQTVRATASAAPVVS